MANEVDIQGLKIVVETSLKEFEKQMAKLNDVTVRELRKAARQVERGASQIEKRMDSMGRRIGSSLKNALTIGALVAAGEAIRRLVGDAAKIGDMADRIGATTDTIQSLSRAAVQADMSFEDMGRNLLKFSRAVGEAQNGSGKLFELFKANKLDVADTFEGNLMQFADLVRGARTEGEKLFLLQQVMGKGSDGWAEVFANGAAGLRTFNTELERSGAKIDSELIRNAQVLDDRWAALMDSMWRKTQTWVLNVVGAWSEVAQTFNQPIGEGSAFFQVTGMRGPFDRKPTPVGGAQPPTRAPVQNFGGAGSYYVPPPTVVPNPEDEAAARKATEEKIRQAEAIDKVVEALKFEAAQLTASDLQQEINNQLRAAGVTAASEQGREIIALTTQNYELARSIEEATRAGEEQVEKMKERKDAMIADAIELRDAFKSTWTEIGLQIADGDVSLKDFGKSLDALQSKITQMALDKSFEILFNMLAQYLAPGSSQAIQFPGRAGGGSARAGQPYEVGESGREVFVPDSNGTIIPNASLNQRSGMAGTVINNYAPGLRFERRTVRRGNDRALLIAIREQVANEIADPTTKTSRTLNVRGAPVPQKRRN